MLCVLFVCVLEGEGGGGGIACISINFVFFLMLQFS